MKNQESNYSNFEVAKAFYSRPNAERDWKTIIMALGITSTNRRAWEQKLRRKLDAHEARHLVKHVVLTEDERYLPRDPELEEALRKSFGLRASIVVDVSSLGRPQGHPTHESQQLWDHYEERIHQGLGTWGGRLLSSLLRPGDVPGTGGGRGLHYTAQSVLPSIASRSCGDVLALTGQIGSDPNINRHDPNPHYVDADFVASRLHSDLQLGGSPILIGRPITDQRRAIQGLDRVNVALIGIGALAKPHRIKQCERLERLSKLLPLLKLINELSESIEEDYRKQGQPFFHPVGDFCNWFFLVDPGFQGPTLKKAKELDRLLHKLNNKFLTTTPEKIAKIANRGVVITVAGGPHKTGAIRYVLESGRGKPWITHLVTDNESATEVLKERK